MESLEEWLSQPDGVATRLRALRVQAALTGQQLAAANDWAQSKVSRIERGQQMPSPEDIEAWCRACGANEATAAELVSKRDEARVWQATFRQQMSHGQAAEQARHTNLAAKSTFIRYFDTAFVPGFLQVPEYMRRIFDEMIRLHELKIDDVDAAIAERLERQQMLYDPSKRFEFLVAEPVLRYLLVTPAVMRTQLDRLQTVIGLDRIRFGVIPEGVELATTPQNSMQIYSGDDLIAVTETYVKEIFFEGAEATAFNRAFDLQWKDAVEGERARELINRAARGLPS